MSASRFGGPSVNSSMEDEFSCECHIPCGSYVPFCPIHNFCRSNKEFRTDEGLCVDLGKRPCTYCQQFPNDEESYESEDDSFGEVPELEPVPDRCFIDLTGDTPIITPLPFY